MAPLQLHLRSARNRVPPHRTPRLRLKPKTESHGYLDGAWWPRTGKLIAELPDLLAALTVRVGTAQRVVYDSASWSRVPRQLTIGDHAVRLDAYPFELGNTMYVYGNMGNMIVLRVIAFTTAPDAAHSALLTTATDPATGSLG
ncbi:DUF5994 family protein [Nocardia pseudobrasiliensis]|uniref:Uncharacterized protein n=1 Tax=Nocardia pseudobrasiliensis TaxID=45979 RepID=A0A370I857_9NOCA|nr:DUF5994 family protein [Nocardia pseudobrasiliensis]RDI66916.1 hypothetical protein DFR76_104669 [Nocardia pseudobrasiliensis]